MGNNGDKFHPMIEVKNLKFDYPVQNERPALRDINFSINRGEFIGIMGPSGAGKTTLCMILKGLIPYTVAGRLSGQIFVNGTELKKENLDKVERKVGFVFQDPEAQIIGLTIEEDLAFGPENHEWTREKMRTKIPELLESVRMEGMELRETWGLSGGQKQRIAIASALILEPDILILDEPTSELDPIGKAEVFETIHRLRTKKNITVIVVEHEIEELAELSDRIFLMNEGQLINQGTPMELFQKPDLFKKIGGERVPQISEVLMGLREKNIINSDKFAITEDGGVEILKKILEEKQ
jgi:energy-coupling factor transporter ATP-binding protein EcfA2